MISQQEGTFYSRKRDFTIYGEEFHNPFKKIKQEDDQSHSKLQSTLFNEQPTNSETMKRKRSFTFDFELHLHTPLPSDWQAKQYSREDHRRHHKDSPKISLDLELNLSPSYSPSKPTTKIDESPNHHNETETSSMSKNLSKKSINRSLSWLALEGDDDDDQKEQEMVTKVCNKCHMLVMLSTSTLVCPNCKFMHPHDHSSTKMFKPSNLLSLLC